MKFIQAYPPHSKLIMGDLDQKFISKKQIYKWIHNFFTKENFFILALKRSVVSLTHAIIFSEIPDRLTFNDSSLALF